MSSQRGSLCDLCQREWTLLSVFTNKILSKLQWVCKDCKPELFTRIPRSYRQPELVNT